MKFFVVLTVLLSVLALGYAEQKCKTPVQFDNTLESGLRSMANGCVEKMKQQIQKEFNASYAYLEIGAYFARDTVNRPGFAEFFFNSAKEEREHGIKLIEYLSMRAELTDDVSSLITFPPLRNSRSLFSGRGVEALELALDMEIAVTNSIRSVIVECEKNTRDKNDYHLVDYLTGVYLEEQYKGQREIAGKISTLKKMFVAQGELAEFLFDKEM